MAIYRGVGGASEANDDATLNAVTEQAQDAADSASDAASSASAAAGSASSAATSATNAATSATNASTSASTATTQASAAASSATNAASSATVASTKASEASTSASNASTSASNAATSATSASGSATTATTKASEASTSATNAASSASSASTSATTATTKASEASTSATNAATSATAAAGSATAAASSATAAAASQTAAAASAASAASAYDSFDDRYLGTKASDPTLDNDGNALVSGALYFNSTANEMRVYDGGNWIAASSAGGASLYYYNYTATSSQTTFSGADDNANTLSYTVDNLIVTLNGVTLENGTDYTATDGTSVVLTVAAATSDELNIVAFKSFTTADMVSATNGGTFQGAVTFSGNALFGDNDKAIFGAGSDLQIYHDSTLNHSRIDESGTGNLQLRAADIQLLSPAGAATYLTATNGAEVSLRYNDSIKLATTSTGIDVTGTVTADGFDIAAGQAITSNGGFYLDCDSDSNGTGTSVNISTNNTANLLATFSDNGDISFYEDTGTTAKFFWDASAESLGIGTSSPSVELSIAGSDPQLVLWEGTDGASSSKVQLGTGTVQGFVNIHKGDGTRTVQLGSDGTSYFNGGNVGIGTSSPSAKLDVVGGNARILNTGNYGQLEISSGTVTLNNSVDHSGLIGQSGTTTNHPYRFLTNGSERMRIDSSGNVGIGTNSPQFKAQITNTSANNVTDVLALHNGSNPNGGGTGARLLFKLANFENAIESRKYASIEGVGTAAWNESIALVFKTQNYATSGDPQERMRIDSSGKLLVNTTSAIDGSYLLQIQHSSTVGGALFSAYGTGNNYPLRFYNNTASSVGYVLTNTTSTQYVTSSDYRLKTDVQPMTGATERLKALNPVNFEWISSGERVDGFLAHEAAEVVPEAVSGEKDAVDAEGNPEYQGIDQSKLVPLLVATVQEQQAVIESLTARIEALES